MVINKKKNFKSHQLAKSNLYYYLLLLGIIILTIFVFSSSLKNKFLNWDDNVYVVDNKYIKDFSPRGIIDIFKSYSKDELPITHLSLAVNYYFSGLNEKPYHVVNLIFHIFNIILVYFFIKVLTKRKEIAIISALLFAIHPLRVESVAWVTERKDMLFTFFFLCSLLSYIKYLKTNFKLKYYILSLVLLMFSLMSKLAAVTLPVVLLLIDYYYERKFTLKSISEKIPFFILAIISGTIHFITPSDLVLIGDVTKSNNIIDSLFFANYSLVFYLFKFILPINLSAFYPYPIKLNGMLPFEYYLTPFIVIILIVLFVKYYKSLLYLGRDVVFGVLFFIITIAIVLHIVSFGGYIITADRYSYLPYLGLFMIIGRLYCYIIDNKTEFIKKIRPYIMYVLIAITITFSIQTYNRCKVFYNSITFWDDIIEQKPNISVAYFDRGLAKSDLGDFKGAIKDWDKAVEIYKDFADSYYNRGLAKFQLSDTVGAINDFALAIHYNPNYYEAYYNSGLAKYRRNDIIGAINDYTKAIENNHSFHEAYYNRGVAKYKMDDNDGAISDYSNAIDLNPKYFEAYFNRANTYKEIANRTNNGEFINNAIHDYSKVIEINPEFYPAYFNRGIIKYSIKDYIGTISDLNMAINNEPKNGLYYCIRGYAEFYSQNIKSACNDWNASLQLGYQDASLPMMMNKFCNTSK